MPNDNNKPSPVKIFAIENSLYTMQEFSDVHLYRLIFVMGFQTLSGNRRIFYTF